MQEAEPLTSSDIVSKDRHERGVHIIYIPTSAIAGEVPASALAHGAIGTATLVQVAKHIDANTTAPTDIVVFAGEPWHFAGPTGHPALQEHPQVHVNYPETVLELQPNQTAVWWSETDFDITSIAPCGNAHPNPRFPEGPDPAPDDPFVGPLRKVQTSVRGRPVYTWRSSTAKDDAKRHMYKIAFTIDNQVIDPDMYCAP